MWVHNPLTLNLNVAAAESTSCQTFSYFVFAVVLALPVQHNYHTGSPRFSLSVNTVCSQLVLQALPLCLAFTQMECLVPLWGCSSAENHRWASRMYPHCGDVSHTDSWPVLTLKAWVTEDDDWVTDSGNLTFFRAVWAQSFDTTSFLF